MKIWFTNYADNNFKDKQKALNNYARKTGQFDNIIAWGPDCIEHSFYEKNKEILQKSRGGGYWLWKPYFIYKTLTKMDDGDLLLYLDSGDVFFGDIRNLMINVLRHYDIMLTTGHNKQKQYCKRDAFVLMDCDAEIYWENMQIEAGMIMIKNTQSIKNLIFSWLIYCSEANIITDLPNICGKENFPEFIDHRHDQAILNNLKVKYNLPESDIIRQYTQGNYDPKIHTHIRL